MLRLACCLLLLLASGAGPLACGAGPRSAARAPRLVVLYVTCTLNREAISPYDASVVHTPNLEAFARESVVFDRHHTEAGQSGIAIASILTGLQADGHGAYWHPIRLSDDLRLVTEHFAAHGFDTFHWNTHGMIGPGLHYDQGVPPEHRFRRLPTARDPVLARVLERLAADPDYRAFLLATFSVTHGPYQTGPLRRLRRAYPSALPPLDPDELAELAAFYRRHHFELEWNLPAARRRYDLSPERLEALTRAVGALYAAGVHRLDGLFGGLVDRIRERGLDDESLVVFTADHGEVLFRESAIFQWSHSMQLAPEVVQVPLLIRAPGLAPGRYAGVTRSIDVFPTLAGLAGLPVPEDVEGIDLSPALRGESPPPALTAYFHTGPLLPVVFRQMQDPARRGVWERLARYFPSTDPNLTWVGLRERDRMLELRRLDEKGWRLEAFDLERDPDATRDVFDPELPADRDAAERLRAYKARLVAGYARASERRADAHLPDEEEAEALRGLGYIE